MMSTNKTLPIQLPHLILHVEGLKSILQKKTIHFHHKINKKLVYNTDDELQADQKYYPINMDNTIMCMAMFSPIGSQNEAQQGDMNTWLSQRITLSCQQRFTYTDA